MVVKLGGRGPGHKSRTPPGTTAAAMTLSGLSTPETSTAGTLIGTLSTVGTTGTPVFALDNSAGSKAAISGANITRGATALSYTTAAFFDITVSVTGVTPTISPTTFRIAVTTNVVDPARFGKPTAATTCTLAGVTRTAYAGPATVNTPGTLIENKNIVGVTFEITAANCIIRNCFVDSDQVFGIEGSNGANLTVENCEIKGVGAAGGVNSGILGSGTFTGNNIYGWGIGIQIAAGLAGACSISGNYIHGLARSGADPHYDGIAAFGAQTSGVLIEGNTIDVPTVGGTSSLLLENIFGAVTGVTFRSNLCLGAPSYTITVDDTFSANAITSVLIEANYLQMGSFGYFNTGTAGVTIQNNIQWQSGVDPIPYP